MTSSPIINGGHPANLTSLASASEVNGNGNEAADDSNNGLVIITIFPDEHNRFGFNVKGGMDQKMPIIVSRVGANTPADQWVFIYQLQNYIKFRFSEMAIEIWNKLSFFWLYWVNDISGGRFFESFATYLQCRNFDRNCKNNIFVMFQKFKKQHAKCEKI